MLRCAEGAETADMTAPTVIMSHASDLIMPLPLSDLLPLAPAIVHGSPRRLLKTRDGIEEINLELFAQLRLRETNVLGPRPGRRRFHLLLSPLFHCTCW